MSLDALTRQHPELPHPVTYDAVADLVERLRADLALAEAVLLEMRADEIANLEARLAALKASAVRAPKVKRQPKPVAHADRETPTDATPEDVRCPICGRDFMSAHALSVHTARAHKASPPAPDAPSTPAPASTPALAAAAVPAPELASAWACATCGGDGPAAISDPTRCKACVRAANPEPPALLEEARWECACRGSFARSAEDPARCIKCTGEYGRSLKRQRAA